MRRFLVCLSLALGLGCTAARDSGPRQVAPDETGETPVTPVVKHDPTKRTETLPPPAEEAVSLDRAGMEKLAQSDPVAFLENVVARYDREVRSYRVELEKRERIKGELKGVEVVECCFVEKPFSVRMEWKKGGGRAAKTLYSEETKGNLLVVPKIGAIFGAWSKHPTKDEEVRSSSRYPITEFGIQVGTRRTLSSWKQAQARGELKVEYLGVKKLKELNDRPVWVLKRTGYSSPEPDSIAETDSTFYFDVENWLQIGSYLTGEEGKLVAYYYFRDLELNVDFPEDTFTRAGLHK